MIRKFVVGALAMGNMVALGADASWPAEPSSVMGISLGQPLPNSIPDCPSGAEPKALCLYNDHTPPKAEDGMVLGGLPLNTVHATGFVGLFQGIVQQVSLTVSHDDYRTLRALLIEKYGPPAKSQTANVANAFGAEFTSEKLTWVGPHVLLTFGERVGKVDSSVAMFIDIATTKAAMKSRAAGHNQDADKL